MRQALVLFVLAITAGLSICAQESAKPSGHYMFAWAGDTNHKENDFLAVIDADPNSPSYGHLMTTVATDQPSMMPHHTEYVMPASGMLFANDHEAGRTFIFDVRDSLHPKIVTSFMDMAGYAHPHSYVRLPNGHVLVTFQHTRRDMNPTGDEPFGRTGGLVEIDDQGKVIRSASSADPAFPNALLNPYSLVVLPKIDRVVSTDSSMHSEDGFRGLTYQVWRLSDLKLLKTAYLDEGEGQYARVSPEEPRVGPDGAVYIQTLACGIERITNIETDPRSKLVYTLPTSYCGVPTIVGHYLIQSVLFSHAVIVLDIADGTKPVEVSRVKFESGFFPHWTGWDAKTSRVVVTNGNSGDKRLYLLKFDPASGKIAIDEAFHDADGKPGFKFVDRQWPQGWTGTAMPHGVVFSR